MNGKVNDFISRRQAIGALNDEYHGMISDESMKIYQIINWISALPSAHPQRKKGKWIEHNPHKWGLGIIYECSECGYEMDCEEPNYCPHCGADMRGKSDE